MKRPRPYLPSTQRFPGGYCIRIKQVEHDTFVSGRWGDWDQATRTIRIDGTASQETQEYTLTHELDHAFNDWRHWYLMLRKPKEP